MFVCVSVCVYVCVRYLIDGDVLFDMLNPDDGLGRRAFRVVGVVGDGVGAGATFQEVILTFLLVMRLEAAIQLKKLVVDMRDSVNKKGKLDRWEWLCFGVIYPKVLLKKKP